VGKSTLLRALLLGSHMPSSLLLPLRTCRNGVGKSTLLRALLLGSNTVFFYSCCCLPCACRNGVGKSTLLRVLGSRSLVGFPHWVTCMHVEQEAAASDSSAVEVVVAADAKAAQLQR
jgi:ATPase subunit of ABC transporter with duplicated ATPase domains